MLDWLEIELRLRVRSAPAVERIARRIIESFQQRKRVRVVIQGPRGGGKTMLAAALQLLAMRFYGASWSSVGGSLEQAKRLYGHVVAFQGASLDVARLVPEPRAQGFKSTTGGAMTIHAASDRSVRGEHPRGPSGMGGIVLDEAALIPDRIIAAATPQLATADPSVVIQLSTLGEDQSGRFWELSRNPGRYGYTLYGYNVFQVAKRCGYECASTCPSMDFSQGRQEGPEEERFPPMCGGVAHETDGWISIDEIAQQHRELALQDFQREYLGRGASRKGSVYSALDLQAAAAPEDLWLSKSLDPEEHARSHRLVEKSIGLDWGFGEACACYVARVGPRFVIYDWKFWSGVQFSKIRQEVAADCLEQRIDYVLPDAANPSDNRELRDVVDAACDKLYKTEREEHVVVVRPVVFSVDKAFGIGKLRALLEKRQVQIPRRWAGRDILRREKALEQLRQYQYDENTGRPRKGNDHACDAALCAIMRWFEKTKLKETKA